MELAEKIGNAYPATATPGIEPGPRGSETPSRRSGGISEAQIAAAGARGVHVVRIDAGDDNGVILAANARDRIGPDAPLVAVTRADAALSEVRRLTRAGVTEVVPDSLSPAEFDELIADLGKSRAPIAPPAAQRRGQVIAVTRARGGVGATTLAVNLADAFLDRRGTFRKAASKRVVLVDLDLQMGDVASFLDLEPNDTLYEMAMTGMIPDETFIAQSVKTLPSGLSVLTAPGRFAPLDALKGPQIRKLIDVLRATHDYVVLDLPCGLVEWLDPILSQSDRLIMVSDCAVPSIRQARRLMDFFAEANLSLKVEMVINHEARPMMLRGHHKAAEQVLKQRFQHWIPDEPEAARSALDRGAPLSDVAPRARMAKAITRLGRDLAASLKSTEAATAANAN
jgi:pilus assembly protein CpaE